MSKKEKLLLKLLDGKSDASFDFADLIQILIWFEFIERKGKGSHRIFMKKGIKETINLQPNDGKAKPYQVKQVRDILVYNKIA